MSITIEQVVGLIVFTFGMAAIIGFGATSGAIIARKFWGEK